MSIMDLFRTNNQNNTGNDDKNKQANNDNKQPETKEKQDVNDKTKMEGTNQGLTENPLDVYAKMFDTAAKSVGEEAPAFAVDPKVLGEVSGKMNFTQGINQELMQKALSGDAQALLQVIQTSNQKVYEAALQHGTALTDTYLKTRSSFDAKKIGSDVKGQLTQNNLASVANYNHPVVRNELNRVAREFQKASPDASAAEIADAAKKYIDDLYGAMNPTAKNSKDSKDSKDEEFDWAKYITGH